MASDPVEGTTFAELIQRAQEGSDAAARQLVQQYGHHVTRAVRRTLGREIRGKFDSDDFAQAVWASFFTSPRQLDGVKHPKQLVGLLGKMARNKVVDEMRRRMLTQKYAVQRERPLQGSGALQEDLRSNVATPSQFAIARERWLQMLSSQPENYRKIMRLKLMGRTNRSIATRLNVSEKTVKRVIDRMTEATTDEGRDRD